jgi:hypothetical protein
VKAPERPTFRYEPLKDTDAEIRLVYLKPGLYDDEICITFTRKRLKIQFSLLQPLHPPYNPLRGVFVIAFFTEGRIVEQELQYLRVVYVDIRTVTPMLPHIHCSCLNHRAAFTKVVG